jgi:DNA-binding NtrC family response regulator
LIIDDELNICKALQKLLGGAGYEADYKTSGREGLDEAKKNRYDVVILDLKIPDLDGIAILKEIKAVDRNSVVIIITAFPSGQTIDEALKLHAYDYITKPIETEKILFVIERSVSYRRLLSNVNRG